MINRFKRWLYDSDSSERKSSALDETALVAELMRRVVSKRIDYGRDFTVEVARDHHVNIYTESGHMNVINWVVSVIEDYKSFSDEHGDAPKSDVYVGRMRMRRSQQPIETIPVEEESIDNLLDKFQEWKSG